MLQSRRTGRRGLTLVEMMIAMVITLMIVFAMVQAFQWVGETTTDGRAVIEMLGQIRQARSRLENDLGHLTVVPVRPWGNDPDNDKGHLEVIEGGGSDTTPQRYLVRDPSTGILNYANFNFGTVDAAPWTSMFGDLDDIVSMTIHDADRPFRGRYQGNMIESSDAEVLWWAELNDKTQDTDGNGVVGPFEGANGQWDPGETFTIRRRVLLVRPDLNVGSVLPAPYGAQTPDVFLQNNDVSVRYQFDATNSLQGIAANSLADLSQRHNRTAHPPIDYSIVDAGTPPRPLGLSTGGYMSPLNPSLLPAYSLGALLGEDIVLTNVLAFDLRVWDANVPLGTYTPMAAGEVAEALLPGDPGYTAASIVAPVPRGGFIDLGALAATSFRAVHPILTANAGYVSPFSGAMSSKSLLSGVNDNFVYDSWTRYYEKDGKNQDAVLDQAQSVYMVDEGTDGLDNNGMRGVDETFTGVNGYDDDSNGTIDDLSEQVQAECETAPPYPYALEAIQVRIRMYESDTRQVRQVTQVIKLPTK
jgi:hypothetical protein